MNVNNNTVNPILATFVDIIHTDSTYFGPPVETGTADFWPNGGKDQPQCPPPGWDVNVEESMFGIVQTIVN